MGCGVGALFILCLQNQKSGDRVSAIKESVWRGLFFFQVRRCAGIERTSC